LKKTKHKLDSFKNSLPLLTHINQPS